jgi:hypothetical protein
MLQQPAEAGPLTQLLLASSLPNDRRTSSLLPPSSPSLLAACAAALSAHASLAAYVAAAHPALRLDHPTGSSSALDSFARDSKQLVKDIAAADASVTNAIKCVRQSPPPPRAVLTVCLAEQSGRRCGVRCSVPSLAVNRCRSSPQLRRSTACSRSCSSFRHVHAACLERRLLLAVMMSMAAAMIVMAMVIRRCHVLQRIAPLLRGGFCTNCYNFTPSLTPALSSATH